MPTDFSDRPDPNDSPMFAPVPAWERNKKRRGFGRAARTTTPMADATVPEAVAGEPRSFTAEREDLSLAAARKDHVDPTDTTFAEDSTFAGTPAYAARPAARRSSAAPLAITAGIILVGGLAAAGWYATQPHDQG